MSRIIDADSHFMEPLDLWEQYIEPTLGLFWEDGVEDPDLAAAHCRAYNTWALEMCAGRRDRFYPVGHVSLRNPAEAAKEVRRLAKNGARAVFIAAMPIGGKSLGN